MKKTNLLLILSSLFFISFAQNVEVNIKVFLEGAFGTTEMRTDLNTILPVNQPYNIAPWYYSGTEQVVSIPNTDIVDWVLVELRETEGDASTATDDKIIYKQAAFLKKDGNIVDIDGNSLINYSGTITNNLYVIIWHRNHLAVMSSSQLSQTGGIYSWDFTDELAKTYLNGQTQISTGLFGMIGGDCDASGRVFPIDKYIIWQNDACNFGYYGSDLNLDKQVDNKDKNHMWKPNFGLITSIPTILNWECSVDFLDTRDNQIYKTVLIAPQCWMAENLNIGIMIPGGYGSSNDGILEKYCYGNDTNNCVIYGGLYRWNEMMEYSIMEGAQGICPDGWHIPTDMEWSGVSHFLDQTVNYNLTGWIGTDVGTKMKSTTGWESGGNGTNASGFTALPGGWGHQGGAFTGLTASAFFWSSSTVVPGAANMAWWRLLDYNRDNIYRVSLNSSNLSYSVRCLMD